MNKLLTFLAMGLVSGLLAAQPSENWTEVNLSITDAQLIPAYKLFAAAADELLASANSFCAMPDSEGLATFRKNFNDSMDAWQQIQHIQFGPITYFNWNFRLHYWPDEKGTGSRQLDDLIENQNADVLQAESFARESVSVQGFPALERLLFDDESLIAFRQDKYRCQVSQAIANNIHEIASGVYQRWVEEFRATIETADERGFFESAEDATIDFLKAQVESVRRIQQQKLEAVIGESAARARIRRAESWLSERSLRNIKLNVMALETLFNGAPEQNVKLADVFQSEDVIIINDAFIALNESLALVSDSIEETFESEQGHGRLLDVAARLDTLFESFEAGLKNTDLYLGFNSLDGD